jgi:putative toxin-antitoxin system antitoxin component (TIGR02293 family)
MNMATEAALSKSFHSAESLLGVPETGQGRSSVGLGWVTLIRQGLSVAAVDSLLAVMQMSQAELAKYLDIPVRTLARRKREGVLSSDESAKLFRLARVLERAETVFEDCAAALDWLKAANPSLDGNTPLSLLDTDVGAEIVLDALGRIEHGIFA